MIRRIEGGLAKRPVSVKDVLRVLSFTLSLSILPMAAVGILSAATIEAPCAEGTGTCFTTTVSYGYVLFLAQFIFYPILFAGTTVLYARRINGLSVSELGVNRLDLSRNAILGLIGGGLLLGVGLALSPLDAILKPYLGENFFAGSFRAAVADVPSFAFLLVYGGLVAPLIEELFFRGYAYQGFRNRFGVVPGLVLSGVLFALAHLDPWDFIGITIFGVILAVLFHKTGSLVSPMVAHATNNIVVFSLLFLGYS